MEALLRVGQRNALDLLVKLVVVDVERVSGLVIARVADPQLALPAAHVLRRTAAMLRGDLRAAAIACLDLAVDETLPLSLEAACALRDLDREHVPAWDLIAAAVESGRLHDGSYLAPVPAARFAHAIQLADRLAGDIACEFLAKHDGSAPEQEAGVALAERLLKTGRAPAGRIGLLVEMKLYALGKNDCYRPWLEFAKRLARDGPPDARIPLIYFFFHSGGGLEQPAIAEICEVLIAHSLTEAEVGLIVEKLVVGPVDLARWLPMLVTVRAQLPAVADRRAMCVLCREYSHEWRERQRAERQRALLGYWSSLSDATATKLSRAASAAATNGKSPDEIFTLYFLRDNGL